MDHELKQRMWLKMIETDPVWSDQTRSNSALALNPWHSMEVGGTFIRWSPFFHKQGCCLPREIENWDRLRLIEHSKEGFVLQKLQGLGLKMEMA